MARAPTFRSNIIEIVNFIEGAKTNLKQSKIEGLGKIAQESFKQAGTKYVIAGNYAHKSKSGKTLIYDTPPGGNIYKTVSFTNKKTNYRVVTKLAIFVKGKFVSRSGHYLAQLNALANQVYKEGSTTVQDVRVEITENGIKVFAKSDSEVFKLETMKQLKKTPISPVTKSFRSAVNIWKRQRIRLGK